MSFKKIAAPICAVLSLIILFVMLHLVLIGPVPVTSIRIDGWNSRTVSREEINAGLKDFSYKGSYIKSESGDPWLFLDGINDNHNMRFVHIDIEDLSEYSVPMQVFFYTGDSVLNTGYYSLYQGTNIICLTGTNYDRIRLDLTNKKGVYFNINEIKFTDNYFLAVPGWFWIIYLLIASTLIIILVLLVKGRLSANKVREKSVYWSEWTGFINDSFREHKTAFIIGSIIVILIFGYEITNFTLGVDEEREIVHSYGTTENIDTSRLTGGEGRYSLILIKHLFSPDGVFTPYVDTLISVIGIALAAIINIISFEKCSRKRFKSASCIIFMGLFCSLPYVVTEWMCYSIMNSGMTIGILFTSLEIYSICTFAFSDTSVRAIIRKSPFLSKYTWLICSSLLCAFTIAIVESLAPYFMISACFCVIFFIIYTENAGFKQFFLKAVPFMLAFLFGFGIYYLFKLVLGATSYTSQYLHWGKESISDILKGYVGYLDYIFNDIRPGSVLSAVSVLCFVLMLFLISVRQKKAERFFLMLFGGLCCFICAFALNIVTGGFTPFRTMIPLMLLTSVPWIIAIEYLASYKFIKAVPVILSAFILLQQGIWVNKIFTGAHLCAQLDMEMGYNIGIKIMEEFPDVYSQKPLVFVGRYQHPSPSIIKMDAVGQSVFWRNRSSYKVYLLRYLGFDFIHSSNDQIAKADIYAQDMPVYPEEGCIQEFDDMIVVRLS